MSFKGDFKQLAALRAARFASVCKGSWLSMALGLTMMVLDVRKNLKSTQFYLLNNLCYNNFAQKSSPGGVLALGLLLAVYGPGLGPDGPGCPEKPKTNLGFYPKQPLFQQICSEFKPWGCPCSRPTSGCLWPWTWPRWSWTSRKTLN